MRNSIIKIISLLLIIGFNWTGLSAIIETVAYYNDTEISLENTFTAGTLDFSLSSGADFSPEVTPTQTASRAIGISNVGTLGFQYTVSTTNSVGTLCNNLNLEAKLDGNIKYNNTLAGFNYNAGEFAAPGVWQFTVTLIGSDPILQDKTCDFDFVFDGSQIGGAGFYDQEIISNIITSGQWVASPPTNLKINEVYYRGVSRGEWVELYNQTNIPINVSGWIIQDNYSSDTLPSATIPVNGFGVIITKESTVTGINPSATIITLDNVTIGNGLADGGDRVLLFSPDGIEIDAMSYGTDTSVFSLTGVASGHSLARHPKGYDTNQASDWVDLTTPNPGTNPHSSNENNIIVEDTTNQTTTPEIIPEDTTETTEATTEEPVTETPATETTAADSVDNQETLNTDETTIIEPTNEPALEPEPPLDSPAGDLTGQATANPEPVVEAPPAPEPTPEPATAPDNNSQDGELFINELTN